MKKKLLLLVCASALLVISIKFFPYHCNSDACSTLSVEQKEVSIGNINIKVEVADTESLREQGLSGRSGLADGSGMLFVFQEMGKYGFWMKDMNFPIDIIWIQGNKVADIDQSVSPDTYPQIFYPEVDVNFVLEAPSGFAKDKGLKVGDFFSSSF